MRLRTYLILSYLALIAILFVGAWFIDAHVLGELTKSAIHIADQAVSHGDRRRMCSIRIESSPRWANTSSRTRPKTWPGNWPFLKGKNQGRLRQTAPGSAAPGHRHPADLHPARSRGVYGFI